MTDIDQQLEDSALHAPPSLRGIDPALYEIRLASHLDERWMKRFSGISVSYNEHGYTCLSGLFDQSALHGVLNKIRDLNLVILSVMRK